MTQTDMNVSKLKFIVLVGPPGVGKSTFIKNNLGDNFVRISSDHYIEEVAAKKGKTYTEVFKEAIAYASESSKRDFQEALTTKSNIVWDQTNLSAKKRKGLLKQIPVDYEKICVYWVIKDHAKWKRQLDRPGKDIPKSVLDSMLDNYEYPSYDEGWNQIKKEVV